jgi:hypothetical protein
MLIVVDDIELAQRAPLEPRFHPEQQEAAREGSAFIVRGKQSVLRLERLTTEGVPLDARQVAGAPASSRPPANQSPRPSNRTSPGGNAVRGEASPSAPSSGDDALHVKTEDLQNPARFAGREVEGIRACSEGERFLDGKEDALDGHRVSVDSTRLNAPQFLDDFLPVEAIATASHGERQFFHHR